MAALSDNPFAVLSAIAAPALLTNACSLLSLGTANRIARVVDRTRSVTAIVVPLSEDSPLWEGYSRQLEQLRTRGQLLIRALRIFYAALGSFAASAFVAVVGAALAENDLAIGLHIAAFLGFAIGGAGVVCLLSGCVYMVSETRIAIQSNMEEVELALAHRKPETGR